METWTTKAGDTIALKDMETSHIENTIKYLERNMPDHEEADILVADHWSLPGVLHIPGAKDTRKMIDKFREELSKRELLDQPQQ